MRISTYLTLLVAISLGVISLNPVWAWEERLKECRDLGVSEKDCPENGTIIVPNPDTPESTEETIKTPVYREGRTTFTKWVWTYDKTDYIDLEVKICYTAHKTKIQYFKNNRVEITDFPNVTVKACAMRYQYPINLVFRK